MSAKLNVSQPVNPQKQNWKDVAHPSVYTNIMQVGLTPFDIGLVFGEVEKANAREVTCIPKAKIVLAPEQAANLLQMLAAALQAYAQQYGQLRGTAVLSSSPTETK